MESDDRKIAVIVLHLEGEFSPPNHRNTHRVIAQRYSGSVEESAYENIVENIHVSSRIDISEFAPDRLYFPHELPLPRSCA
jgi:hypothetical protein